VYFDALFQLVSEKPESEQELLGEAHALIEKLKKSALEASILKRGPFLAELELDSRMMKEGKNMGKCRNVRWLISGFICLY
jgi:N-terminal acetyltransferase B complex non-catalytic subunit